MHDQHRRINLCYSEKNDPGLTAVTVKSNSFRGSAQVWRLGGGSGTASLRRGAGARRVRGVGWGLERGGSGTSEGPGKASLFILNRGLTEPNLHFKFIAFPILWRES